MKSLYLLFVILLTGEINAETGNQAYESQNYPAAVVAFQKELEQKGPNASLLYNLGNSHYRTGNYGAAILAYEQALILSPRSSDIKANLKLARKAAAAFDESNPIKILHFLSYNEWMISVGAALLLLGIFSYLRAFDLLKRCPFNLKWVVYSLLILILVAMVAIIVRFPELNRAIVIEDTTIRLSPFETADSKATLKPGQSVTIKADHDDFFRIESGWVSKQTVKPLRF